LWLSVLVSCFGTDDVSAVRSVTVQLSLSGLVHFCTLRQQLNTDALAHGLGGTTVPHLLREWKPQRWVGVHVQYSTVLNHHNNSKAQTSFAVFANVFAGLKPLSNKG
jgi:hypothetical protein